MQVSKFKEFISEAKKPKENNISVVVITKASPKVRQQKTGIKTMLPLKEAIQEKHTQAEIMPFNARMFKGELSKKEYLFYLHQQASIFQCIEEHKIPQMHPKLNRLENVFADIQELQKEVTDKFPSLESTKKYGMYLESLTDDRILAHIYLNYLALMFGGQMMKQMVNKCKYQSLKSL